MYILNFDGYWQKALPINIPTSRVKEYLLPNTLDQYINEERSLFLICTSQITSKLSIFSNCIPKDYQDGFEQVSECPIVKVIMFRSQSCTMCSKGTEQMIQWKDLK